MCLTMVVDLGREITRTDYWGAPVEIEANLIKYCGHMQIHCVPIV